MPERPYDSQEAAVIDTLKTCHLETVPLFLTPTGFKKSLCDATDPIRRYFLRLGVHDYANQAQGQDNKVVRPIRILTSYGIVEQDISMYRPVTKQGDPRLWVYGLKQVANGGDVLGFFAIGGQLHLVNYSKLDLSAPFVQRFIREQRANATSVSDELLAKLKELAKSPIPAVCQGDTAIGRSVESALGIKMNSRPEPDYKGIELKAKRSMSRTRSQLFAQVADWELSPIHSSKEMLDRFGYERQGAFRLYCTLSSLKQNTQGLVLDLAETREFLYENCLHDDGFVERILVWRMSTLENRLQTKHHETFWIHAKPVQHNGKDYFQLRDVTHTANPNIAAFGDLLADGTVTVDHLIKRKTPTNVVEKGPLFKIKPEKLGRLFFDKAHFHSLTA